MVTERPTNDSIEIAVVQADLSKFYDRVRPNKLHAAIERFKFRDEEDSFFSFAREVFNWTWAHPARALRYASDNDISGFSRIALPQGLVSAGFFANVFLSEFDNKLREAIGTAIGPRIILRDVCRYVDDLRCVVDIPKGTKEDVLQRTVTKWLNGLLETSAPGMEVQPRKTKAVVVGREQRFKVPQSAAAERLQRDVSGPFDVEQWDRDHRCDRRLLS